MTMTNSIIDEFKEIEQLEEEIRERLVKLKKLTRTWEGEPGDPEEENNILSVDDPQRYM